MQEKQKVVSQTKASTNKCRRNYGDRKLPLDNSQNGIYSGRGGGLLRPDYCVLSEYFPAKC